MPTAPTPGPGGWTRRSAPSSGHQVRAFAVSTGTAANSLALATLSPPYGAIYCHTKPTSRSMRLRPGVLHRRRATRADRGRARQAHGRRIGGNAGCAPGDHTYRAAGRGIDQPGDRARHGIPSCGSCRALRCRACAWPARPHGWLALRQRGDIPRLSSRRCHLARWARRPLLRSDQERRPERRGGGVLRSGAGAGLRAEAQARRPPAVEVAFVAAQLLAYVESGVWRRNAERANALARRIGVGRRPPAGAGRGERGVRRALITDKASLREAGFEFYDWGPPASGPEVRLVASWDQSERHVEALSAALAAL